MCTSTAYRGKDRSCYTTCPDNYFNDNIVMVC